MIKHYIPTDLADTLNILHKHDCYIMAGGTDLMVQKHVSSGLAPNFDRPVLYIMGLKELDYISYATIYGADYAEIIIENDEALSNKSL